MIKQIEVLTTNGWVNSKNIKVGDQIYQLNQDHTVSLAKIEEVYHFFAQDEKISRLSNNDSRMFTITGEGSTVVVWNKLGEIVCRLPWHQFKKVNENNGYNLVFNLCGKDEHFTIQHKKYIDTCIKQKRVEPNIGKMGKDAIKYYIEQWIEVNSKNSLDKHILCKDYKDASTMQAILIQGGYFSRIRRADGFEVIITSMPENNSIDNIKSELCGTSLSEFIDDRYETITPIVRIEDQTTVI